MLITHKHSPKQEENRSLREPKTKNDPMYARSLIVFAILNDVQHWLQR